jgi:glycosyltransferase involved in cell wall biosynthesis
MLNSGRFGFIVCGQVLTGRLEVLETFFVKRFKEVFIIGISSIFARENCARRTIYRNGNKYAENKLFNLTIKKGYSLWGLLFSLAYCTYFISIMFSVFKFRFMRKNLAFIGIGCFPALLGIIFKRIGLVKKVIYYSIDYFPPLNNTLFDKAFVFWDGICVKMSDLVWSISPKIEEARERFAGLTSRQYRHILVPLCFDESLLRFRPLNKVERWSIVFVGTSGYLHGLHLIIEAMPSLLKIFPEIKVKLIGPGPWDGVKKDVDELGLTRHFDFAGFIKEEAELFEVVSRNALGLALYVPEENNPTLYADPGKPKLYAFCSVPVVISKTPFISRERDASGAGQAIDFNVGSLIQAITEILSDTKRWDGFRRNAFSFAKRYTSKNIFEPAIEEFLKYA